jgi:signal transduction histidine kinase
MVDPAGPVVNSIAPPVQIEAVKADGKVYSVLQDLRLPALTRDLEFDYTALSLVMPQRVRFRYRLEGYDTDWKDAGTRRSAFYTNLSPNKYTFRVIACNNDGIWNEKGAALIFTLQPAFFQTAWFNALCAVVLILFIWVLYRLRVQVATERVRVRLSVQLAERERIARELHDTLLQGFQGLVLRFQGAVKQIPVEEPIRQQMEEALNRADEALFEGRNRVRDLRSESANADELPESLARWAEELGHNSKIEARVSFVGARQSLHPIVCDEACRIGREAITNAFQHSRGSTIEVEITYSPESLRLRIRDDGNGIDQHLLGEGRSGHWGLAGMRERAQKIGAQLNIWTSPEAGTEIDLAIPGEAAYQSNLKTSPLSWLKRAVGWEG